MHYTRPKVLPWMSAGAFLTVSLQELLVIFNRKLLQMINYIGSVVQSYITLTPRDPGLTHTGSWCLAFSMFWEYISTLRVKWVIQLLHLYYQLTCRLSQVTLLLVHGPAQTTEWNMDWWCGSELSVQYPMNKLCQYWTWYQYWIGPVLNHNATMTG